MRLVFSSVFEDDFSELIVLFSNARSAEIAARFEENTYELISLLQRHPEMGRPRKDLNPKGIRSFRVHGFHRYLLFYRLEGKELVLLRIRYGGMNLQTLFRR